MTNRIGFIGGGNMAYALAMGLLKSDEAVNITVADPAPEALIKFMDAPVSSTHDNIQAVKNSEVVVLAVKPQILADILAPLAVALSSKLVISIAAGVPITSLTRLLNNGTPIIRCMPNTPALYGSGITGMIGNNEVGPKHRKLANQIMEAAGSVVWFQNDIELDAVTAISGSGPAYFFYLIEAMVESGKALGISPENALRLASHTALGAAKMMIESGTTAEKLRSNVTSPGGTTERAISILDEHAVRETIQKAIVGAYQRSQELAKEYG